VSWRYGRRRAGDAVLDYFENEIEVGDIFYCGNPCAHGRVIKIRSSSIMLETGADYSGVNTTMNVRSPEQGIVLNKIPKEALDR
jgi:hypothetical protein